jgi:hypothetical protein
VNVKIGRFRAGQQCNELVVGFRTRQQCNASVWGRTMVPARTER